MPRTRSLAWSELKIGILAVTALLLAALLTVFVGGESGFFWQRYHLKTRFANVQGLKAGAVVRVAGVEVGKVASVSFDGPEVELVMEVRESMREHITGHSRSSIGSVSLLGEPVVDISPSGEGTPVEDWGYVQASQSPRQLADVAESASLGLREATRLVSDVREGKGTVGRLFTDDSLYKAVDAFVSAAEAVTNQLAHGEGAAGRLLRDPEAYRTLIGALKNLDEVTRRIGAGEGSIGRLIKDDAFATSLASATGKVDELAGKVNQGTGTAGKLVNDPALYDRLATLATRLEDVSARLDRGEGTAGQLLHDTQLYENMNSAATELRGLVSDIRKDPKKYLNIKVSIF